MNYEYPIEQLAQSAVTQFQKGFAELTMHLMPTLEDIILEPSTDGLRILGTSELALAKPGDIIRQIHDDEVELSEPRVRLLYGRTVREPIMWIQVNTGHKYAEAIVQDLVSRNAEIEEVDWLSPRPFVLAKAPLRNLLGYPQTVATQSQNTADLKMWLSHYAPVSPGPDNDAV